MTMGLRLEQQRWYLKGLTFSRPVTGIKADFWVRTSKGNIAGSRIEPLGPHGIDLYHEVNGKEVRERLYRENITDREITFIVPLLALIAGIDTEKIVWKDEPSKKNIFTR